MLDKHLVLTFSMVWTMVVADVVTVAVSSSFLNHLAKLIRIRGSVLIPFVFFVSFTGTYTSKQSPWGSGRFAVVRICRLSHDQSRLAARPLVLILIALTLGVLLHPLIRGRRARAAEGAEP